MIAIVYLCLAQCVYRRYQACFRKTAVDSGTSKAHLPRDVSQVMDIVEDLALLNQGMYNIKAITLNLNEVEDIFISDDLYNFHKLKVQRLVMETRQIVHSFSFFNLFCKSAIH